MTQYNTLNVKLSNTHLNKLKYWIKYNTEVTLKLLLTIVSDSNENNFPHNIKLSKVQLHKIGQSGGFLGRLLGPLLKSGLPLMGNMLKR